MKQILIILCLLFVNFSDAQQAKGKFASESAINRSYAILFDAVNNVISTLVNLSKVKYQNQEDDLVKVSTNVLFRVSEAIKALNLTRKNQKIDIQVIEKLNDEIEQLILLNSSLLKLVVHDMDGHDYECDSGNCQRNDVEEEVKKSPKKVKRQGREVVKDQGLDDSADESEENLENQDDEGYAGNTIQSIFSAALDVQEISQENEDNTDEEPENQSVQSIFRAAIDAEEAPQDEDENSEEIVENEAVEPRSIQEIFSAALDASTPAKEPENGHISVQNIFKKAL